MDLLAKKRVVVVSFNSPNPDCSYTEYMSKLILAPESSSALSILEFSIT